MTDIIPDDATLEIDEEDDEEFEVVMDAAYEFAAERMDEIIEEAVDEDLYIDLVMYNIWTFASQYLAESGWSSEELKNDVVGIVEHQTSEGAVQ